MGDGDPKTSILTPKQREWLRGESDIEPNSNHERTVRRRIRKRLQAGIADLSTLFWHLEDRDLESVYEEMDFIYKPDSMFGEEYIVTPYAIQHALAFFLQRYQKTEGIEQAVERALNRVSEKRHVARTWDVTVNSEDQTLSVEELEEQLQAGEITPYDIRQYHDQGRIGFDAYIQLTRNLKLFKPISRERYHELLEEPVPMLEEDEDDE